MKFEFHGKTYMVENWTEGYCLLPSGNYVMAGSWVDGSPRDIYVAKLYVQPANCAVAKEAD